MCSICAETEDPEQPTITLDCGHTFHGKCVVEWFRYQNVTCPNCRSDWSRATWTRRTPGQRISAMRRCRTLDTETRRKIGELDTTRAALADTRKSIVAFKRQHASVMREYKRLRARECRFRHKETVLTTSLGALVHSAVPFLDFGSDAELYDDDHGTEGVEEADFEL